MGDQVARRRKGKAPHVRGLTERRVTVAHFEDQHTFRDCATTPAQRAEVTSRTGSGGPPSPADRTLGRRRTPVTRFTPRNGSHDTSVACRFRRARGMAL
jgi:hypothetical protein